MQHAEDDHDWNTAKNSGEADVLLQYLRKHPFSDHYTEAMDALSKLQKKIAEEPTTNRDADAAAWRTAARLNSASALEGYLNQFPNGAYASVAQQKIALMQDTLDWESIASSTSEQEYESYLSRYPNGPHAAEAQRNIDRLEAIDAGAWEVAKHSDTIEGYQTYLRESRQGGSHLSEATKRIASLQQKSATETTGLDHPKTSEVSNLFFPKANFLTFEKGHLADLIDLKYAKPVRRLMLSNDLSRLYTGGDDGALRIWDLNQISHSLVLNPRHKDKIYA